MSCIDLEPDVQGNRVLLSSSQPFLSHIADRLSFLVFRLFRAFAGPPVDPRIYVTLRRSHIEEEPEL